MFWDGIPLQSEASARLERLDAALERERRARRRVLPAAGGHHDTER
jgi:hypothetical protein